jgi:pseudouridine kinase
MTQILTTIGKLGAVVFGAANVDIAATTTLALAAGDSTPGCVTTAAGGVGRNIAENLARLGHPIQLVSAVGDDLQGQFLLDHTRRAGVDVSACSVLPGQTTGTYLSLNNPDGSLLAAVNDMAVLGLLTPDILAHHAARLANVGAWVVDCNLSEACIKWVMHNSSANPVFVDGVSTHKCLKVLPYLAQIHTLKINRLEAQALTGLPVESAAQALAAAQSLCALGTQNVVVSLGSGGVCWSSLGGHGQLPAIQVSVVNSNGAGDALTAGLAHGALAGWPLDQAVRFANACAALTMLSASANHPDLSETNASRVLEQH